MKRTYVELMQELEEKWTVENVTAVLDEMGIEYELVVEEEGEQKVSVNEMKTGEIKEYKYRLRHRVTGQFVSYLDVISWNEPIGVPHKIGAIEFSDIENEAEIISFKYDDGSGENTHYPLAYLLSRHEDCYGQYLLDMEVVVEDEEEYVFYSQESGMYLWGVGCDWEHGGSDALLHHLQFNISPQTARRFKIDSEEYHAIRSKTYLRRVDVSDID